MNVLYMNSQKRYLIERTWSQNSVFVSFVALEYE